MRPTFSFNSILSMFNGLFLCVADLTHKHLVCVHQGVDAGHVLPHCGGSAESWTPFSSVWGLWGKQSQRPSYSTIWLQLVVIVVRHIERRFLSPRDSKASPQSIHYSARADQVCFHLQNTRAGTGSGVLPPLIRSFHINWKGVSEWVHCSW